MKTSLCLVALVGTLGCSEPPVRMGVISDTASCPTWKIALELPKRPVSFLALADGTTFVVQAAPDSPVLPARWRRLDACGRELGHGTLPHAPQSLAQWPDGTLGGVAMESYVCGKVSCGTFSTWQGRWTVAGKMLASSVLTIEGAGKATASAGTGWFLAHGKISQKDNLARTDPAGTTLWDVGTIGEVSDVASWSADRVAVLGLGEIRVYDGQGVELWSRAMPCQSMVARPDGGLLVWQPVTGEEPSGTLTWLDAAGTTVRQSDLHIDFGGDGSLTRSFGETNVFSTYHEGDGSYFTAVHDSGTSLWSRRGVYLESFAGGWIVMDVDSEGSSAEIVRLDVWGHDPLHADATCGKLTLADCDDGQPCTVDGCSAGHCTHAALPGCP